MPDGEPGTVNIFSALSEQLGLIRITEMLLLLVFPANKKWFPAASPTPKRCAPVTPSEKGEPCTAVKVPWKRSTWNAAMVLSPPFETNRQVPSLSLADVIGDSAK